MSWQKMELLDLFEEKAFFNFGNTPRLCGIFSRTSQENRLLIFQLSAPAITNSPNRKPKQNFLKHPTTQKLISSLINHFQKRLNFTPTYQKTSKTPSQNFFQSHQLLANLLPSSNVQPQSPQQTQLRQATAHNPTSQRRRDSASLQLFRACAIHKHDYVDESASTAASTASQRAL